LFKVKKISIRNFLSIGNVPQVLNLDKAELTLILGENMDQGGDDEGARSGTGKTTILNAISYALFSWPISVIKKDNLVNKTNDKNMVVELEFEVDGVPYKIIRGRKPSILEFYKGGKLHQDANPNDSAQGDSRETQNEIVKIIGMTFEMFCQIVALNTYTLPFLMQKSNEQRALIEELLGISILGEKAERLKADMKIIKDQLTSEEIRIKAVTASNDRIQTQINRLNDQKAVWDSTHATNIATQENKVAKLRQLDIDSELATHEKLRQYAVYTNLLSQRKAEQSTLQKEKKRLLQIENEVSALEKNTCQTCGQTLHTEQTAKLLANVMGRMSQTQSEIGQSELKLQGIEEQIEQCTITTNPGSTIYSTPNEAHKHMQQIMLAEQQLARVMEETNPYLSQIQMMESTALEEVSYTEANELKRVIDHMDFLYKLLTNKDSYLRKFIIDQNLAFLNTRLSHYLVKTGLPHTVSVVNDMSITITQLGRELSAGNLSRGEMTRVSISLSLAMRDVWEYINRKVNLIWVDELLDNGLDENGAVSSVQLLHHMAREQEKSVWLVSHREEVRNKCNSVLKALKRNGFTTLNYIV